MPDRTIAALDRNLYGESTEAFEAAAGQSHFATTRESKILPKLCSTLEDDRGNGADPLSSADLLVREKDRGRFQVFRHRPCQTTIRALHCDASLHRSPCSTP